MLELIEGPEIPDPKITLLSNHLQILREVQNIKKGDRQILFGSASADFHRTKATRLRDWLAGLKEGSAGDQSQRAIQLNLNHKIWVGRRQHRRNLPTYLLFILCHPKKVSAETLPLKVIAKKLTVHKSQFLPNLLA